jgi:outer membrane protein
MKKTFLLACIALLLFSNIAMAESIAGKFGVTVRGGIGEYFNNDFKDAIAGANIDGDTVSSTTIKGGVGWTLGTGFMYGITDNLAVDFDIIYSQFETTWTLATLGDRTFGKAKTFDFSFGAQWRFRPKKSFVPYIGAGLDVMINNFDYYYAGAGESIELDNTYGGHLTLGADYFLTPNIALNAEFRYLCSTSGDMTRKYPGEGDVVIGSFSPSNVYGVAGIRFFFP